MTTPWLRRVCFSSWGDESGFVFIKQPVRREIPRGVWVLGFVSLFMDISSELVHSLLPVFMVSVLSASALQIGLVEGVAEATALIAKVFSGTLSDLLGRRKGLILVGYGAWP